MSDIIERIKKRIEDVQSKLDRSVFCDYDNAKYDGYECALIIIDEELAKEPQENSQARMIVESLSSLYNMKDFEEEAIEEILNSQPQVQPINTDSIIKQIEEQTSFLKDCTKYGNKDSEQQHKSYSTMMMYEVADLVDDLIEIVRRNEVKEV